MNVNLFLVTSRDIVSVSIRRSDNNGYDILGLVNKKFKEPSQLNTMDGQYVPTVTPIEIEGVDKTSTDVQGHYSTTFVQLRLTQMVRQDCNHSSARISC